MLPVSSGLVALSWWTWLGNGGMLLLAQLRGALVSVCAFGCVCGLRVWSGCVGGWNGDGIPGDRLLEVQRGRESAHTKRATNFEAAADF